MISPDTILADLEAAGVRLWPESGLVHYRAAAKLSPSQAAGIVAHKAALLDLLAAWDAPAAQRLMHLADDEVERCGCCGADAAIQRLAGEFVTALRSEDMSGVRRYCALVEERARRLEQTQRRAA